MTGSDTVLAIVLTESALAASCGGKTWSGTPALRRADELSSPTAGTASAAGVADVPRYLDGDWLAADGRMRPVAEVLTDLLDEVARELGLSLPVPAAVVAYPTRWGGPTRAVLETAVRATAVDATFVPIAVAAATAYAARPEAVGGYHRLLVVEADALTSTVTCVAGPGSGPWRIDGCAHEPTVGVGDDPFAGIVAGLAGQLVGAKGLDATLVIGPLGAGPAEPPGVAEKLRAQLDRSIGSPMLRELDGAELAHALPGVRAEPAPPPDPPPLPPVTRLAPARWLDTEPHRPLRSRRPGPAMLAGAVTLLLAVAGAAVFWLRTEPGVTPSAVAAGSSVPSSAVPAATTTPSTSSIPSTPSTPDPTLAASGVRLELPPGWQRRPGQAGAGRLELVPGSAARQRIVLVRNNLAPGAGYDEMAAQLTARVAASADVMGDLRRDVEFGGRHGLAYTERPTDGSLVDWHVVVERDAQLSVGCQYLPGEWNAVAADCERVVRTVGIDP